MKVGKLVIPSDFTWDGYDSAGISANWIVRASVAISGVFDKASRVAAETEVDREVTITTEGIP